MLPLTVDSLTTTEEASFGLTSDHSFETGLMGLLCMNVADGFFTLGWIYAGMALEANPVMAEAIRLGPDKFILSKFGLVTLACMVLWRNRSEPFARLAIIPMVVLYAYVMGGDLGFALGNLLDVIPRVM